MLYEVITAFQACLEAQPEGDYADQTLLQIGNLLMDLERYDEARATFERLTRSYPGSPSGTTPAMVSDMTSSTMATLECRNNFV